MKSLPYIVLISLTLLACSRAIVVRSSDGSGGSGTSSTSTATSSPQTSSSSASSTSTGSGHLTCIIAIGECEVNYDPTPGVACKTSVTLTAPDGTCDAQGNCCRSQ